MMYLLMKINLTHFVSRWAAGGRSGWLFTTGVLINSTATFGNLDLVSVRGEVWWKEVEGVVKGGVKKVGDGVFKGCRNMIRATIPEGVEEIGRSAFEGCVKLTTVPRDLPPHQVASA